MAKRARGRLLWRTLISPLSALQKIKTLSYFTKTFQYQITMVKIPFKNENFTCIDSLKGEVVVSSISTLQSTMEVNEAQITPR